MSEKAAAFGGRGASTIGQLLQYSRFQKICRTVYAIATVAEPTSTDLLLCVEEVSGLECGLSGEARAKTSNLDRWMIRAHSLKIADRSA